MKQSSKKINISHDAKDLFGIVLDIEKYPNYIPWCEEINIVSKNKNEIFADMKVKYSIYPTQIFTSHVIFDKKKLNIMTQYIKGPLKDLTTEWIFLSIGKNKTLVNFDLKFEFKNFIHQKIAELFFPLVEEKMISSFINRADDILN